MTSSIEHVVQTLAKQSEISSRRAEEIAKEILHVLYKNGFYLALVKYQDIRVRNVKRS